MRYFAETVGSSTVRECLVGVSAIALSFAASPTLAQDDTATDGVEDPTVADDEAIPQGEVIIVTGSRLRTDGMQAPVPVTVVQADTLEAAAPDTLISAISQLPQFYGNQTPNSGNFFVRSGYGSLNLRGLGVNRTLTLLNGRRAPSSSAFGGVDINLFPEAMVRSVETVTGGASAAYGSDAVAGVVNFILDTDYSGLEMKGQYGVTDRGDGDNYELSASFGTNIGDRGHIMVSGEYFNQDGVFSYEGRDWYQAWGTIGSGTTASPYTFYPNVISRNASFDGVISSTNPAINGLAFDRDGNLSPFVSCSPAQAGPLGIPPARHVAPPGSNCSGDDLGYYNALYPDLERYSLFGYADYDLTDELTAFVQYIHGKTKTVSYNSPRGSFGGTPTALTIFQDNAFLPDSLRQTMIANNIQSFTLRRMGSFEDIGRDYYLDDRTTQDIGTIGATYDIAGGFLDGWQADAFYQYGKSLRDWRQKGLRVDRIFAAVDAVDDGTGNIVCRTSLFGNAFPGCVPINLFGRGNASGAAIDYVTGFEPEQQISTPLFFADTGYSLGETYDYTTGEAKRNLTTFKQHLAEFSLSGDLFDIWAGPVAVAVGASYRKESIRQVVQDVTNPASDHETGHPVLCNGEAPGLRGVSAPDCGNTVGVQYSKVSNIRGNSTVKEAFGEILVPLVSGGDFVSEAAANGAVRYADYSGSGGVWAYKGGLEVEFLNSLRLRGTYSRDVRAANLSERFDKTGGTATIFDPRYAQDCNGDGTSTPVGTNETCNVTRFSGGNPAVAPEKADTYTLGAVFRPDFVPGLSLSVDWYDIKLKGAISQVGSQEVANRCEAGDPTFCALITRDPTTDRITLIGDIYVNVAQARVSGVDAEVSYVTDTNFFGGDETLGARVFASWLTERSETDFAGTTIDYAGQTGARQSDGVYFAFPDFKATGNLTYRVGPLKTFLQGRYIGKGKQDQTPANILADNSVDDVFYTDFNIAYTLDVNGSEAEIFANVNNLFDADPPVTPSYSAFTGYSTQVNTGLFDILGRRYTFGIKLKY